MFGHLNIANLSTTQGVYIFPCPRISEADLMGTESDDRAVFSVPGELVSREVAGDEALLALEHCEAGVPWSWDVTQWVEEDVSDDVDDE